MTSPNLARWLPALCLVLLTPAWALDSTGGLALRHNPFARPGTAASLPATPSGTDTAWRPPLRAVVVAGGHSAVLVDGQVLELGDELDGYRLIQVLPDKAIFKKKGRRVELSVGASKAAR